MAKNSILIASESGNRLESPGGDVVAVVVERTETLEINWGPGDILQLNGEAWVVTCGASLHLKRWPSNVIPNTAKAKKRRSL